MKQPKLIQSIQRAINIIDCFSEAKNILSLVEISEKLELNINTTRGIVQTLVYNGYLYHDENTNTYSLGLMFLEKGRFVETSYKIKLEDTYLKLLEYIANKYKVSTRLQAVSNNKIMTIKRIDPENSVYLIMSKTTNFLLNAMASGKLLLYYMSENEKNKFLENIPSEKLTPNTIIDKDSLIKELNFIEKNGFSKEIEEIDYVISSIAYPILDRNTLVGTISITSSTQVINKVYKKVIEDIKKYISKK